MKQGQASQRFTECAYKREKLANMPQPTAPRGHGFLIKN